LPTLFTVHSNYGLDSLVCSSHRFRSVVALKPPHSEVASAHVLEMVD